MPLVERILELIAPHECLSCGREGQLVCIACSQDAYEDIPERCYRCLVMSTDNSVCKKCRRQSSMNHVWISTEYQGISERLIKLLKFERAKSAAKPIGERMASSLPYLKPGVIVCHLPTATSRQRGRGYDQAELLAKRIAKDKNLQFTPLLARFGQSRQVGATRKLRFKQAESMFHAIKPDRIKGKHILLVDDILTTGASLEAGARALRRAGAARVDAVVFAQKH